MIDESDDAVFTDVTKTPAWTSAPETIGLALSDETEDWCFDFHDAQDVSWFSGPNPVDVFVTYVRSDIVADLRARLAAAESRLRDIDSMSATAVRTAKQVATVGDVNAVDFVTFAFVPEGTELIARPARWNTEGGV